MANFAKEPIYTTKMGGEVVSRRVDPRSGYVLIGVRNHPLFPHEKGQGYVTRMLEHRLILSEKLGYALHKDQHTHHRNGIKHDNRPENLEMMYNGEHRRLHNLRLDNWKPRHSDDTKIRMSLSAKSRPKRDKVSDETREKLRIATRSRNLGSHHSELTKQKLSNATRVFATTKVASCVNCKKSFNAGNWAQHLARSKCFS